MTELHWPHTEKHFKPVCIRGCSESKWVRRSVARWSHRRPVPVNPPVPGLGRLQQVTCTRCEEGHIYKVRSSVLPSWGEISWAETPLLRLWCVSDGSEFPTPSDYIITPFSEMEWPRYSTSGRINEYLWCFRQIPTDSMLCELLLPGCSSELLLPGCSSGLLLPGCSSELLLPGCSSELLLPGCSSGLLLNMIEQVQAWAKPSQEWLHSLLKDIRSQGYKQESVVERSSEVPLYIGTYKPWG